MPRRLANVACALALASVSLLVGAVFMPAASRADSTVVAGPGLVEYLGDDSPHQLEVWTSQRDVRAREWVLRLIGAATGLYQQAPRLAGYTNVLKEHIDSWKFANERISDSVVDIIDLPPQIDAIKSDLDAVNESNRSAQARVRGLLDMFREETAEGRTIPPDALDTLRQEVAHGDATIERITDLERQLTTARETLTYSQRAASDALRTRLWAIKYAVRTTGRLLVAIGQVAVFTEGIASLGSIFTANRVLIRDNSGGRMTAVWPCTDTVRAQGSSAPLPNTVSCPAAYLPSLFSGMKATLLVKGGAARDIIDMKLAPDDKTLTSVLIEGGGGDDLISGSSADEQIAGGTGSDTIFGSGGDDSIEGRGPFYELGPSSVADGNNRLIGGAGADTINGAAGNDLVAGGSGDDLLTGGDGNDTLIGGDGVDAMGGAEGRDAIFAKESDFPGGVDAIDSAVSCGWRSEGLNQPVTLSPPIGGRSETAANCDGAPRARPSTTQVLLGPIPSNGIWPWYP